GSTEINTLSHTTLFRSHQADVSPYGETPGGVPAQADVGSDGELRAELVPAGVARRRAPDGHAEDAPHIGGEAAPRLAAGEHELQDRKSTRLNSSHVAIS